MENELLDGFRLGEVRVEPLTGTIRRNGDTLHLPSRSVEVLLLLAKHPRRLVSRAELLQRVWGEGRGSSEALNRAIREIRLALDDRPENPRFIQTVRARGYRLLLEPDRRDATADHRPPGRPHSSLWRKLVRHGVVQATFAYAVIGWLLIQVAGETFVNLGLPTWTVPFVTFAVVSGFPIVILLSWFLEMSGGKMVVDDGTHEGGLWQGLGRNYVAIIAAYAIAAAGNTVYQISVGFTSPVPGSGPSVADAGSSDQRELIPVAENSIAVLRFANFDGGEMTQIFANGLSEDILDRVARVPGMLVSARGDSWSLPVNARSEDVRRRLRVAYYLEGSVRIVGDMINVVAQLIDSATGFHVVSRSEERALADFSEIQNEITDLIVAELRVALPEDIQQFASLPTNQADVDAYVEFRRGRDIMDSPTTLESIAAAENHYRNALAIDPGYAAAHAGLCGTYTRRYIVTGEAADIAAAEQSCGAALASAPRLSLVYRASGSLHFQTGRLEAAERDYLNALEIDPRDADALLGLAEIYSREQRYADAEARINRAIELQPGNWRAYNTLGALQFAFGRYEEAAEAYSRVAYLQPENFIVLGNMATSRMMAGDFEAASEIFERALATEATPGILSDLGILYYYLGDFPKSVEYHRRAVELVPASATDRINLADSLHFAGRETEARSAFEEGVRLARESYVTDPTDPETLTILAWAETMLGNVSEGIRLADQAIQIAPDDPYSFYYRALVALQSNDPESAMDAIITAANLGYSRVMLAAEPYLEPLRDRMEYLALISADDGGR